MNARSVLLLAGLGAATVLALRSGCKDAGSDPPPVPAIFSVEPDSGNIGDEIKITGSGFLNAPGQVFFGTVPATQYDEWKNDEIKVFVPQGAVTGLVRVKTEGGESNGILFRVIGSPGGFGVTTANVNLTVGDSTILTISGGTAPYVVVSQSNPTAASATISGSSLTIRALAVGTSLVVIGDAGTPQLTDTVSVTVTTTAVSFANDVYPIFNAYGCTGCHPSNGGLSLASVSVAYANLVNVNQQASPGCASITKRVLPNDANQSVLYRRVAGATCGERMPRGGSPLLPADVQKIMDWINQGALNN